MTRKKITIKPLKYHKIDKKNHIEVKDYKIDFLSINLNKLKKKR